MATLSIAWISLSSAAFGNGPGTIRRIVSSENLTTSGTSAVSGACPDGASHARLSSADGSHYVMMGNGTPVASALNSIMLPAGGIEILPVPEGDKIAARTI